MKNDLDAPAPEPGKVAVLLSGGVDSAMALHLLKEQGCDVAAAIILLQICNSYSYSYKGTKHESR